MGQRHNDPISFKERGPGLEVVVDVLELESHCLIKHHDSPETILLVKWVDDLTIAAKAAFMSADIALPTRVTAAKPAAKVAKNTIQGSLDKPFSNSVAQLGHPRTCIEICGAASSKGPFLASALVRICLLLVRNLLHQNHTLPRHSQTRIRRTNLMTAQTS
ncbi:hypothetical protein EDB19DRAFT_1673547 [Suillus lakei]|nr:hypothetical protein EDB19DRAFT_1673547 [Suillus lakei]